MDALPVGFSRFHADDFLNYQLNRAHSLGSLPAALATRGGRQARGAEEMPAVFLALAAEEEAAGRLASAAGCARVAEFFTPRPSEAQRETYLRYRDLWDRAHLRDGLRRVEVPYEGGALPVLVREGTGRGAVVFFGGFDSLIEEFYAIWGAVAEAGYTVVAFDGPGQGGARTLHGLVHTHDWERPVGAVLDALGLEAVTLVGLSMGGYWAIRAAGREPRVQAVVAWPPVYDWLARLPRPLPALVRWMVSRRAFMNASIRLRMRLIPILRHVVAQANWLSGGSEPADCPLWFLGMNAAHLGSERVRVPTLLFAGERDRFQPPALARLQARALTAAPVQTRVFSREEGADAHCQIGNLAPALQALLEWLGSREPRP